MLPLLVFLMVGVIDLGRIYTTMLTVESAVREAADYGAFDSSNWGAGQIATTEADMQKRACLAASNLPDYQGGTDTCTNPGFSYLLSMDKGATWVPYATTTLDANPCDSLTRKNGGPGAPPPCWVRATLTYTFNLLVPLNFQVFGVTYGIPNSISFTRSSTFATTDLTLP